MKTYWLNEFDEGEPIYPGSDIRHQGRQIEGLLAE